MSDPASRKSETQISKFAASKNASRHSEPTIGDISAVQSKIENQNSAPISMGNIKDINPATNNDVLGDITLLEEAFAEMEDNVEDMQNVELDSDDNIPMLQSTIEQPSVIEQAAAPDVNASIPVLDQQATGFTKETTSPSNESPHSESEMAEIPTLNTDSSVAEIPASEAMLSSISESVSISEQAAMSEQVASSPASEPMAKTTTTPTTDLETNTKTVDSNLFNLSGFEIDNPPESSVVEMQPVVTTFDADEDFSSEQNAPHTSQTTDDSESIWAEELIASESVETITQPASQSKVGATFNPETTQTSIEEKIAQASGDTTAISGFNEIPLSNERISIPIETELAAGFVEEPPTYLSVPVTHTQIEEPVRETPPGMGNNNSAQDRSQMSIPFELHSQLSKKIDELVLDATMSLTSELELQLSQQLESLLGNAVESVLPKLVDQMANELRTEVKKRVKHQLPTIVNDVLGKTRLS